MTKQTTTLLYFAPVPWSSYAQRPHYFVGHFLKRVGTRAVWIDPYPTRLPHLRDLRRIRRNPRMSLERPAGLTVISTRPLPLEPLAVGRWLNHRLAGEALLRRIRALVRDSTPVIGVGRPSSLAVAALAAFEPAASFYDAMDDFPEFYSGVSKSSVTAREREITRNVHVVLTSSSALWRKFDALGTRRLMVHNAFEMAALPPLPIARNGHRVFGYVGCIGPWFDWTVVVRLARAFRDVEVQVVGPCFLPPPRPLPGNVRLLPACPQRRAIEHFRDFSVGLIPFKRTRLTDGVDPVKYYGYRGMGLPVLTTTFGEMAYRGIDQGAYHLDRVGKLEATAEAALADTPAPATIERFRQEHTWERRFHEARVFDRARS